MTHCGHPSTERQLILIGGIIGGVKSPLNSGYMGKTIGSIQVKQVRHRGIQVLDGPFQRAKRSQ